MTIDFDLAVIQNFATGILIGALVALSARSGAIPRSLSAVSALRPDG